MLFVCLFVCLLVCLFYKNYEENVKKKQQQQQQQQRQLHQPLRKTSLDDGRNFVIFKPQDALTYPWFRALKFSQIRLYPPPLEVA